MKKTAILFFVAAIALSAMLAQSQFFRGGGRGRMRSGGYDDSVRTPREMRQNGYETPFWTNAPGFEKDVFTFVRIKRDSGGYRGGSWRTDAPDSDLNLAFRLQQMTS